MKLGAFFSAFILVSLLVISSLCFSESRLATYNGGFFTISIPAGWKVYTAGRCSEFAIVVRDSRQPLRQIFFFGSVGPVYMSQQQKQVDWNYMNMGGYPVPWIEMPVVNPLTPKRFMEQFQHIASTRVARQFMPQAPRLENLQVISVSEQPSPIYGGRTGLIRALFTRNGNLGEGLFLCTTAPLMPYTGGPGGGIAYGFMITGTTAPKAQFARLQPVLARSIGSLTFSRSYISQCMQASQAAFQGVMKAGQTLRQASDIIMEGWQNRNKVYDIIAEKRSDAILGFTRVYNPDTGETFRVDPQFWDNYKVNQNRFQMNNLQPIPNDRYDLWNQAPRPQWEIR